MIGIEEARARILAALTPTGPEMVALPQAWGRVTAAPVLARVTQPPHDVSAMDGYALAAVDAAGGGALRVAGTAPAGHPWPGRLAAGEALRVFTGSLIPAGADSVLLQEQARRDGDRLQPAASPDPGRHVRRAGQDFSAGDLLLPAGRRLGARDIGLAAAANHAWLRVHRRPRVAILATGDEIALPGDPLPPGGIVSSNTHMLAALVRAAGGQPCALPIAGDDPAALDAALGEAGDADLLLTTGGASVGDHDLVREVLGRRGLALEFWRVAMRPGKPLLFGRLDRRPVLGLPGNPVSALVTALQFAAPAIARLSGLPGAAPPLHRALLDTPVAENDERADHLRARLRLAADGTLRAACFPAQDSAMLRVLAQADALVLRAPHALALPAGAEVPVIRLDQFGL